MVSENQKKWIWISLVLVFIVFAAGAYFLLYQESPQRYVGPVKKVTLGIETSMLPAAVWVAEEKGFFIEEGIDVSIKEFDSGRLSFQAMLDGEGIDISTVAPTPIMFSSFETNDFAIFSTFVYSYDDIKVIARKDKGINSVSDLIGKRIGTPLGTTGQFFLDSFLIYNGLTSSDVDVISFTPSQLPISLEDGSVDAIVIWEPHGSIALERLGNNGIRLPSSKVYRTTFNFVVMNEFIEDNEECLVRFLKAIDRATDFLMDNRDESIDIVSLRLAKDKQDITSHWDESVNEIALDQSLIVTLEDEARWAIRNNFVDNQDIPNYLNYIYFEILEKVKPEVITIIR